MEKTTDQKFCHECAQAISLRAEICPKCGVRQPLNAAMAPPPGTQQHSVLGQGQARNKNTAGALAFFLGGLGAHKFYIGQPIWGAAYILFCWTFIPMIFGAIEGLNFYIMSEKVFADRHGGPAWSTVPKTTSAA